MIVLLHMSSFTNHDQVITNSEILTTEKVVENSEPYAISLQVKKLKDNTYNLIIEMELAKDAHYVSPNSTGNFSGQFALFIDSNTNVIMDGKFSESPLSKEINNPFGNGRVSFVKENTTHTKQFTITDKNDFEISGSIQFVIEPRCTMEKIPFTITNTAGKIEIKKNNSK